jgi:hypothetical protein
MSAFISLDDDAVPAGTSPLLGAGDRDRHFGVGPGDLPRPSYFMLIRSGPKDPLMPNSDFGDLGDHA